MVYQDPVYGKFKITEPIILELLASKPLKRLKKITHHGASVYNQEYKKRIVTRFEHCMGVCLLLKRFNASLEEQIAGLLHDISHTVFSHVIDFVFPNEEHTYHEKFFRQTVIESEIPKILKKYKIDLEKVLDEENFPLLERKLPALCADRLDYFLRDMKLFFEYDHKAVLNDLAPIKDNLVFLKRKTAQKFAYDYAKMNDVFWAHPFQEYLYSLLAEVIREALKKGYLAETDFFDSEKSVFVKLWRAKSPLIIEKLEQMEKAKEKKLIRSRKESEVRIKSKIRVVDPLVLVDGKTKRLSTLNKKFGKFAHDFREKRSKPYWVRYNE
jgi:HD superfamily phosphohydrolase